jgi:hypothetical protein
MYPIRVTLTAAVSPIFWVLINTFVICVLLFVCVFAQEEKALLVKQEREVQMQIQFQRDLEKKKEERSAFAGRGSGVHDFFTIQQQRVANAVTGASTGSGGNAKSGTDQHGRSDAGSSDNSHVDLKVKRTSSTIYICVLCIYFYVL